MSEVSELVQLNPLETKSPSLLYNIAVCEAFQRSAERAQLPEGYQDTEREVIMLGGSFGKGLGTYFSDLDIVDFTTNQPRDSKWTERFTNNMKEEFHRLTNSDPRFAAMKKYSNVSQIIKSRFEDWVRKIQQQKPRENNSKDESVHKKIADRQAKLRAIAERATARVSPTQAKPAVFLLYPVDVEIESFRSNAVVRHLYEAAENDNLIISEVMLLLSSVPGINAYEVTPGNLRFHQERIVRELRLMHDTNPEGYRVLSKVLQKSWRKYKYTVKSLEYIREIRKTREDVLYPFGGFFQFDTFPSIDELERFFNITSSSNPTTP